MPNHIEHRAFTISYDKSVSKLVTPVSVLPVATVDKLSCNKPVEVEALWDTGATSTCIKPALFERLNLRLLGSDNRTTLTGIGGNVKAGLTLVNLLLTSKFGIEFCPVYVLDFPSSTDVLIGMDIIKMGDFVVCNADSKTSFSFAVPPFPDRINLVDKAETTNWLR